MLYVKILNFNLSVDPSVVQSYNGFGIYHKRIVE